SSTFGRLENMEEPSKFSTQSSLPKNDLLSNENETNLTSEILLTSELTTTTTNVKQINIDGVVNTKMLHAHLVMLAKFHSLEQQDSEIDERYLLRAEKRYLLWLKVLNNVSFKDDEEIPIPPIDVCQVWHAHLLSPLRYFEDIKRLYKREFTFPLAKLHELWSKTNGDHMDERSKQFWEENTKQPWILDPNDTSDFELVCPWCSTTLMITANNYVKLMRNPKDSEKRCDKCKFKLSIGSLSAKRFMDDIQKYNDGKKVYIATVNGEYNEKKAISDSDYLFNLTSTPWNKLLDKINKNPENCNWTKIVKCIKRQISYLKSDFLFQYVRMGIIRNVIFAYSGTPLPFSIGLVSAVIRQREFTNKMVNNSWINDSTVQSQATIRYHKFLLLQKDAKSCLVPTLDIDLCWHTHMLHAPLYRNFTNEHINRIINHDDTLSKSTIANGFAETSSTWYKKFKEPYTCEHPKKYWLTTKKMVAAVILPPYAIYLMYKMNKYKKGTVKKDKIQNSSTEKTEYEEKEYSLIFFNKYNDETNIGSKKIDIPLTSPTPSECKGTCGVPTASSRGGCGSGGCGVVSDCG
ncbi:11151_t:CDS:2, partial [Gigaspora rosea]